MTKLDVLSMLESIPVCTALPPARRHRHDRLPRHQTDFHHAKPVYTRARRVGQRHLGGDRVRGPARGRPGLPRARRGSEVGVPVAIVGIGQRRDQMITLRDVLAAA